MSTVIRYIVKSPGQDKYQTLDPAKALSQAAKFPGSKIVKVVNR